MTELISAGTWECDYFEKKTCFCITIHQQAPSSLPEQTANELADFLESKESKLRHDEALKRRSDEAYGYGAYEEDELVEDQEPKHSLAKLPQNLRQQILANKRFVRKFVSQAASKANHVSMSLISSADDPLPLSSTPPHSSSPAPPALAVLAKWFDTYRDEETNFSNNIRKRQTDLRLDALPHARMIFRLFSLHQSPPPVDAPPSPLPPSPLPPPSMLVKTTKSFDCEYLHDVQHKDILEQRHIEKKKVLHLPRRVPCETFATTTSTTTVGREGGGVSSKKKEQLVWFKVAHIQTLRGNAEGYKNGGQSDMGMGCSVS